MSKVYDCLGPDGFGAYEVDWEEGEPRFERVGRAPNALLIPGFVDIHIHGAFGIDCMTAEPSEIAVLCMKLEAEGYEGFLPTTVTAPSEAVLETVGRLPNHPMILGFHLEGPFISPKHPGAQPPQFIQDPPMVASEWDEVLDHPRLRLVTLAPERPGALELTSRLLTRGVITSMGHTDATFDEARRGFEFGAAHATHTFNAMRPFHHREPGVIGYVLHNSVLLGELIYDRLHIAKETARLLFQVKGATGVIAVSDGTMASGMPAGTKLEMWGLECFVGRGDVRLADGRLAGSAITLKNAFRNLYEDFGPEIAIRACCTNPRRALGMTSPPRVWLELNGDLEIVGRFVAENGPAS